MITKYMNFSVARTAELLGASEPAFRLLLTILAGYPLAGIYRLFLNRSHPIICHLYFTLTGSLLYYFNYSTDVYHSIISIFVTYIWLKIAYNSRWLVTGNFIFHMTYLLCGYYFTESDEYDIKWTMPHCVLTLRLIGLVFDISDGRLPKEKLSNDQKQIALTELPSLLELFGFSFFPGSFIVGPQYPFKRYQRFVNKEFEIYKNCIRDGLIRGCIGILYLTIRQIGSSYIPDNYLLSDQFKNMAFIKKLVILGIWGRLTLYKYISCWLITEGALICFGLTFVSINEKGEEDWSGCTNVKIIIFEKATKLSYYVNSFNVNTNNWVAMYVYKRLKFLGNRMISHAAALLFLAVWHGFHTGYYISFFFEFVVVTFERQFQEIWNELCKKDIKFLQSYFSKIIIRVLLHIYTLILMGWCLVPFVYFNYKEWIELLSRLYYFGFIFFIPYFLGRFLFMYFNQNSNGNRSSENSINNSSDNRKTE